MISHLLTSFTFIYDEMYRYNDIEVLHQHEYSAEHIDFSQDLISIKAMKFSLGALVTVTGWSMSMDSLGCADCAIIYAQDR